MPTPSSSFDLETYISRYASGHTKIKRLEAIAVRATLKSELGLDALRMAIDESRHEVDTSIYRSLVDLADGTLGPKYEIDEKWIEDTDRDAGIELEKLRKNLEESRKKHNKEVIRISHDELGDFYFGRGKFKNARGEYMKTRDYGSVIAHNVQMVLKIVKTNLIIDDYPSVESQSMMITKDYSKPKMLTIKAKLDCCAGLAKLARGQYLDAALKFLSVKPGSTDEELLAFQHELSDVMSLEDVAVYGGLCALATLSREGIKQKILENTNFRSLLETMPEIRELTHDFHATKYSSCLEYLSRMEGDFTMDLYLGRDSHLVTLYNLIRTKALIQYIEPFATVDLKQMSRVFNCSAEQLESELIHLIEKGGIDVRIDMKRSCLVRKKRNVRTNALSNAVMRGQDSLHQAEAMLLRMSLSKNHMRFRNSKVRNGHVHARLGPRNISPSSAELD